MDQKIKQKILVSVILVLIISIILYFVFIRGTPRQFIEIEGLYNSEHILISHGLQSVVGGVEGVKYVKLKISVENRDKVPLNLYIKNMTPKEIDLAKSNIKYSVISGGYVSWITDFIDVESYEGIIQDFCATVESEEIPFLRSSSQIYGCVSLKIDKAQLTEDFDIQLDSGTGISSINPGCNESWVCSDWSSCTNSAQKRTCADKNSCETEISKPIEEKICSNEELPSSSNPIFATNSNGDYKDESVWITIDGRKYYYGGYSSYQCLSENIILKTSEGYSVCTRPSYEITRRVYIQQGNFGLIFKP